MTFEEAAERALDGVTEQSDPSLFVARNGLRLRLKRVSQLIVAEAQQKLVAPQPPVVFIEEKGRDEPNPLDPDYLRALQQHGYTTAMLAMRIYYVLGTEPVRPLPPDLEPPESTGWSERIQTVVDDIDIPPDGPRRYLQWLKLYALPNDDQNELMFAIIRFSGGTLEGDVRRAAARFQDQPEGRALAGLSPASEDSSGAGVRNGIGDDPRVRGEGSSGLYTLPVDPLAPPPAG